MTTGEIIGFHQEISNIQSAIAEFESGQISNIAIIAEPFAGKTTIINEIEKMNKDKVTKISFSSIVINKDKTKLPRDSKRIVIVDDCNFLYERRIGGFEILEYFLSSIVSPNNIFITTWNIYSWNYLDEVMNIGNFFPVKIYLPKFTKAQIKEFISSMYKENEIKFEDDVSFERDKFIESRKYPVLIRSMKKTIDIPYLKINYSLLKVMLSKKEERISVENLIYEKIHNISNGNPGVAKIIWERSLEYPTIRPSKIKDESLDIDLNINESFVLSIILSMKSINKDKISDILGDNYIIDEIIFRLIKLKLITKNDKFYIIRPEALKSIVEYLKKLRMVW